MAPELALEKEGERVVVRVDGLTVIVKRLADGVSAVIAGSEGDIVNEATAKFEPVSEPRR